MTNFLAITGWIIGLLSFAFAIWIYFKTREVKRVVIGYRSVDAAAAVPENSIQPSYIFSDGRVFRKVYFSYLYLSNRGTKTVSAADFRTEFKVKMLSRVDVDVLDWTVVGEKSSTGLEVSKSDGTAEWSVKWSHLDPGQSITIEAYTDVFVESVTSDGDFSYQTSVVDSDKLWKREHMAWMNLAVLIVGLFLMNRPIWHILSTGRMIDLNDDRWNFVPPTLLMLLAMWVTLWVMSWLVSLFKPGPRYIPPVG